MKKVLLLFLVTLAASAARAQRKFEVYGGYGVGSAQEIVGSFSDLATSALTGGNINSSTSLSYGPVMLGVNYYLNPAWSVGLLYSNTRLNEEVISGNVTSHYSNKYNVVMARTDYRYINRFLQLYSGVAAGVSAGKSSPKSGTGGDSFSSTDFAFQVNALGLRVGHNFGAFAELGFGYNGIVSLGVSAKF